MTYRLFILAAALTAAASLQAKTYKAFKTNVKVDGDNKEWATSLPNNDKATGLQYDLANDEKNMYLIVRVADTTTQKQILQYGFKLWINVDGKKKENTGITFPVPPEKTEAGSYAAWKQQQYAKYGLPQNPELFVLTGFYLENGKQPVAGSPVKVAANTDSTNNLVIEYAIPFNAFYKEKLENSDLKKKFSLEFFIPGTSEEQMFSRMSSAMSRGGGMGMGGFGMGGPPNMNSIRKMMSGAGIYNEKYIWITQGFLLK